MSFIMFCSIIQNAHSYVYGHSIQVILWLLNRTTYSVFIETSFRCVGKAYFLTSFLFIKIDKFILENVESM